MKRPNTSVGGVPPSFTTKVCTDDAHTPPALVTSVAKIANPPATNPAPIQILSETLPGRVLK